MSATLAAVALAPAVALGHLVNALAGGWVPRRSHAWRALANRIPIVEAATVLLVTACVARFGLTPRSLVAAFFLCVLVLLSVIDAERHVLPNRIVLPATGAVLAAQIAFFPAQTRTWVLAALLAALCLFLIRAAYPPGLGMGDVKLALLLGAALGATVAVALVVGVLAAALAAAIVLTRNGAKARRRALPFGPFLAFGAIVAVFFGEPLLHAYLSTL
jgi:leader peptidase (prepilin peptidase) / N-methyltransferase